MWSALGNWLAGKVTSDGMLVVGLITGWFALQFLVLPGLGVST